MIFPASEHLALHFAKAYALLLWNMLWPLAFGFLLSAWIRTRVPAAVVTRHLGTDTLKSAGIGLVFGIVSSVCNYAVVGMGGALRSKGASWPNVLLYMIASTNLGITMLVAIYGFLGRTMLILEVCTAVLFLILGYFLAILYQLPPPEPAPAGPTTEEKKQGAWIGTAIHFYDDVVMTRRDILVGMAVASAVGVLAPDAWWKIIFIQDTAFPPLGWLWNAVLGIVIAVLTFGCSVGNVALAAVMWWNGVTPGGVMAFMIASLLTVPMLQMYVKLYSRDVMLRLAAVNVTGILAAALIMDAVLAWQGVTFDRPATAGAMSGGHMDDIRLALNIIFGVAGIIFFFVGRKHSPMAAMKGMSMEDMALMGAGKGGMDMSHGGMGSMKMDMPGMAGMSGMSAAHDMPGMRPSSGGMGGTETTRMDMPGMENMPEMQSMPGTAGEEKASSAATESMFSMKMDGMPDAERMKSGGGAPMEESSDRKEPETPAKQ